jgi:DNA-binding beta-propeller fold protein YncE
MLVRGSKGYVTSLYGAAGTFSGGKVNVINLASNTKEKEIQVGDNPEGLALVGERLYVANHGFGEGRTVNVISTITDAVVDTIDVDCDGPRFLESDPDGDVFVFCTGRTIYDDDFNEVGETEGAVRVLEGATGHIVDRLTVDGRIGTAGPGQDTFHTPESGVILAVKDESTVLIFDTRINQQTGRIGPISGDPIGALAYDELAGVFYLGRSSGFTTAGKVTIHLTDGSLVGEFAAGIAPAYILLLD